MPEPMPWQHPDHCDANRDPDAPGREDEFNPHIARRCMADIQPAELRWLWPGRFALGKVNLLCGPPGDGKSFTCLDMAARVSTGCPWPDRLGEPNPVGRVVLLSGEDDPHDTIRPRLDAAEADVGNIFIVDGVALAAGDHLDLFRLDAHLPLLQDMFAELKPRLCIVDPVSCYLGRADSHKDSDLRKLIAPLASLAGAYAVSIVLVSHLNKRADSNAMNRIQGSIALPAAARTAWLLQRDPADDGRRVILKVKCNLDEAAEGIAFRIQEGRVCWLPEAVTMTADDVLADNGREGREKNAIALWLADRLATGPVPSGVLKDEVENATTFTWASVQKAKDDAGVVVEKCGFGRDGFWQWRLKMDAEAPKDGSPMSVRQSYPSLSSSSNLKDSLFPSLGGRITEPLKMEEFPKDSKDGKSTRAGDLNGQPVPARER